MNISKIRKLVASQAEDEGLWFEAETASEAYLQQELRRLHAAIENKPKVTHGRHCSCSACAAEDWTRPELACCGMHGPTCPAVYAPLNSFGIPETLPHEIWEDE